MSVYDMAKDAVKIAQKADNIELVQKILDIQKEALEMQDTIQGKNEEIGILRSEINKLEDVIATRDAYVLDRGVYWLVDDTEREQPFCPTCKAKDVIVPMQKVRDGVDKRQSLWSCSDNQCRTRANPWDYKRPSQIRTRGENWNVFS